MKKQTPGPWKRFVYEHGGSRIYAGEQGRILIADTYQPGDADLLFAAPQLLGACQSCLIGLENGKGSIPFMISMLRGAVVAATAKEDP